ncbi:carbonic anhydrase 12-like [Mizuhopecten yessoensis]|uniref:carbonic anhydrase n=1 Tax=Mizuhopecten yessoensis TaxID=6573 RepID=A0A210PW36_MIZYE|nr:carbonic anhydrase 12-like [Mizuhopecten yessoensis]OWF40700.1 Carbonic anhydrase [Mizuhopecten yessoensis]
MENSWLLLGLSLLISSVHAHGWGRSNSQGGGWHSYGNGGSQGNAWSGKDKSAGYGDGSRSWNGGTRSENAYGVSDESTGTRNDAGGWNNAQQESTGGLNNEQQGSAGSWSNDQQGSVGGWNNNQKGSVGSWHNAQQGTWNGNDGSHGTWGGNHVVSRDAFVADDGSRVRTERHYYTGTISSSGGAAGSGGQTQGSNLSVRDLWRQKLVSMLQNGFRGFRDPWKTSLERGGVDVKLNRNEEPANSEDKHAEKKHDFDYDRNSFYGPENWSYFWSHCTGTRQSPIDVQDSLVTYKDFSIKFGNLPVYGFRGKFFNNGHAPTFTLSVNGSTVRGLPTSPDDKFQLIQFHFHFACDKEGGSEHKLNGHRMDAEMHMVHYNTKYESFDKAMGEPDGLAVVAVFFKAIEKSMGRFDRFINANEKYLLDVSETGCEAMFDPFLLVPKKKDAYAYEGSLTTPGCLESVSWIILKNPVFINLNTMRVFREMHDGHGDEMITVYGNCRPIQPQASRPVYANFHP